MRAKRSTTPVGASMAVSRRARSPSSPSDSAKVWASPSTWYRLVRQRGWRRPRLRVHPAKPKIGLRTTRANEMWHIDTTVIRLLDGTRAYLHAVIENFSRRILAWRVADTFAPANSVAVLVEASRAATPSATTPVVLADAGVENVNAHVDDLITTGVLRRVLACRVEGGRGCVQDRRRLKRAASFVAALAENPSLRLPTPLIGRVGDKRGARRPVSSPRHVKRSVRISRTPLSCVLRAKGYTPIAWGSLSELDPNDRPGMPRRVRADRTARIYSTCPIRNLVVSGRASDVAAPSFRPSLSQTRSIGWHARWQSN